MARRGHAYARQNAERRHAPASGAALPCPTRAGLLVGSGRQSAVGLGAAWLPMNLDAISSISQVIGSATIVGGTIFGVVQVFELKKQRRDSVAGELMRSFMHAEFSDAITLIRGLPDGVSAEELRRAGPEVEKAAVLICMTFETMGLMVFQRIAPFGLVLELTGGIIVVMWRKLAPWLDAMRTEQNQPSWAEWFQWLAHQCDLHKTGRTPAYARYPDWIP